MTHNATNNPTVTDEKEKKTTKSDAFDTTVALQRYDGLP